MRNSRTSSARRPTTSKPDPELGPIASPPAPEQLSPARAAVLRLLIETADTVTVSSLAAQLDQHPNTVREHLDALVSDGRAQRVKSTPSGRGRPAWLYQATGPTGPEAAEAFATNGAGGTEYASLALALIDQVASTSPDPRRLAREAGENWGRSLVDASSQSSTGSTRTAVVEMLRQLRFESEPQSDDKSPSTSTEQARRRTTESAPACTMRLTTCPILDAAKRNPDVVCQVHLGIVRGALDKLGGNPDSAELQAFAEPGACLLTLNDQ